MRSTIIHTGEPAYKGHHEERDLSINQSMNALHEGFISHVGGHPLYLQQEFVEKY